jgi:hypothetical protein
MAAFEPDLGTPLIEMPSIPVLASSPEPPGDSSSASDATAASQLFGQYMGQIDARIERAWMRPRTPIGSTEFFCSARVTQDFRGNVLAVRLERCNGDSRWQRSLINAIQSASPLPSPADPRIFAQIIHLHFKSDAYSPRAEPAMYETASMAARAASAALHDPQRILSDFRKALRNTTTPASPSINLNITGHAD